MFKKNEAIELDKATYRVIEFIHRGNQAQVWQVASEDGERRFALKVVCPFEAKSGRHTPRDQRAIHDLVQRAEMEIAFLRDLPNAQAHHILPCLDSGTVIWQNVRLPALLAPLMHEELSLYCPNLSHKPKPFSLEKALTWFRQIAQALAYVHGLNSETHLYIHSNIKPSNILLDAAGNAFLTDFGILKAARHTGTTSVACNHDYCAPEQRLPQFLLDRQGKLENQYYLTPATDLYALGAVVYSLFGGGTAAQDRLAEESTVNTHLRTLEERVTSPNPASPVGLLGQIGGLTKTEAGKLRRVLMDLQSHNRLSAGSSVIDPELDAGLPNPAWIADRIVELVEKLLAAWPNHRPTASTVLTSVIDLQAALSPCLQRIAFRGETHFQSDQEIVLHLDFAGEGLAPDLNWIKVEFQGKILENLHPELIGQAKDTGV
ncbi:MAG: protein kinase domain-containing protein, partial [Methylococcales bacterium]